MRNAGTPHDVLRLAPRPGARPAAAEIGKLELSRSGRHGGTVARRGRLKRQKHREDQAEAIAAQYSTLTAGDGEATTMTGAAAGAGSPLISDPPRCPSVPPLFPRFRLWQRHVPSPWRVGNALP